MAKGIKEAGETGLARQTVLEKDTDTMCHQHYPSIDKAKPI